MTQPPLPDRSGRGFFFIMKPEQAEALAHLTNAQGFAVLLGEAGTGKSHTLNAVRAAYEAEGFKTVGLSWTNKVVQAMRDDGFANAATIAASLKKIENGRGDWNSKTVLIVDEAAMVSTESLAKVAAAARAAHAKLILAGDDAQLSSIEKGGMFERLRMSHDAAVLKEVMRVKDQEQKVVLGEMHEREFLGALQFAEKAGRLHWTSTQDDTLRAMADKYTADVAASPDKRRFMFAFTNAEVDALNAFARDIHQKRGDLGTDHTLATAYGAQEFAAGDRILFSGNGRTAAEKRAGLTNGNAGTITDIDMTGPKPRVTVALDTAKGAEPRSVSFIVGENAEAGEFNKLKLGYAGTIYKGQGATLDQTYVCHSAHWKSSSAYVALSRHKESVEIWASMETVKDLASMARSLGRSENKRAATVFHIDPSHLARAGFGFAAEEATQRPAFASTFAKATVDRKASAGRPSETTAPAAALNTSKATERRAYTGRAAPDAGTVVKRGARRLLSGLAEGIFKALMGESPAPPPRRSSSDDDRAAREQQQQKALDALARAQGFGGKVISEADLRRLEETAEKNRDRGRSR